MTSIWDEGRFGSIQASSRLVMAPMTRSRAKPDGVPGELAAEYYAQRAGNGMIVTEGIQPSEDGQGYLFSPGLHSDEQVAGWLPVTEAVHGAGGAIVAQLMHVGRVSHPSNTPHGRQPVGPSAISADAGMFTLDGMQPMVEPRALTVEEIGTVVTEFADSARRAIAAGFDGVEIHGANGYLIQQFLATNANMRQDEYGGSTANRIRFALEVTDAVIAAVGADRVGFRVSPGSTLNDLREDDAAAVYTALVEALAPRGLAYLHVLHLGDDALLHQLREGFRGPVVVNRAGAPLEARMEDLRSGAADAIAVGTLALANPDLPERIRAGGPFNEPDRATFYGGGAHGYTDYPTLAGGTDTRTETLAGTE